MRGYPEVRGQIEYLFLSIIAYKRNLHILNICCASTFNKLNVLIAHTEVTVKMLSERNKTMGSYSNL